MKKILLLAASLLALQGIPAESSCMVPGQAEESLEHASTVFAGRVIDIVEQENRPFADDVVKVIFEVSEVWKGEDTEQIAVTTLGTSTAGCGFSFTEGEEYLVYAHGSGDKFSTSLSSGTKLLSRAQADLSVLNSEDVPTDDDRNRGSNIPFKNLEKSAYSGINQPFETVIQSPTAWTELWGKIHYNPLSVKQPPEVDLTEKMVIGVGIGDKASGGYSVEIQDITVEDNKLSVNYVERQPGTECGTTTVITQPYHLVVVERSNLPIEFNRQVEVKNCSLF